MNEKELDNIIKLIKNDKPWPAARSQIVNPEEYKVFKKVFKRKK